MHHANVVPPKRFLMKGGDGRFSVKYVYCEFVLCTIYGVYVLITHSE